MTLLVRDVCEPHVGCTGGLSLEQGLSEKNCMEVTREQGRREGDGKNLPERQEPREATSVLKGILWEGHLSTVCH